MKSNLYMDVYSKWQNNRKSAMIEVKYSVNLKLYKILI